MADDEDRYVFIRKTAFPREVATPERRTVESWDEFKEFVDNQVEHTDVFVSLYSFKETTENGYKPKYDTCVIENLYFDIDPEIENEEGKKVSKPEQCWEETKKIHRYLKKHNIRHNAVFSGGGFHIYARTNNPPLVNKKATLYNAVMSFVEELELEHVDPNTVGDFSRISRVPNSWNFKDSRKRFCIPLNDEHIGMTYSEIKEEAKERNFDYDTWGEKKLDLEEFDSEEIEYSRVDREAPEFSKDYELGDLQIGDIDIPRCIQRLLEKGKNGGHIGYRGRFILLQWFKERGLGMEETTEFLKPRLKGSKDTRQESDWEHMMNEYPHEYGMLGYIWNRDMKYPSHNRLVGEGFCEEEWGECQDKLYWGKGGSDELEKAEGYTVDWTDM